MGITLEKAAESIGRRVTYRSAAQRDGRDKRPGDDGTIERVGLTYVFVNYNGNVMATAPTDLDFLVPSVDADDHQDKMIDAREALDTMKEHS